MIIQLFGGLGLFLFGMNLMGDGLENAAGEKLKSILEKITSNKFVGVLVGTIVTAVIQSSSATTVMVVSFVNAGLMSLMQAVGVIMGANIGTTITAQMVSFKLDAIAPITIGFGAIAMLATKKKRIRDIASIFLGFGILFLGMSTMSVAMQPLAESNTFKDVIEVIGSNRFLGVLSGLAMTAIVQSSSATTGILVALATTNVIDMNVALPIIFGCNIGTCVTALLASVGSNRTAKKAALIHLCFNVLGVIIFIPLIDLVIYIVESTDPHNVARQVANAHTIFNLVVTAILLPFSKYLVLLVNKILPGDGEVEKQGAIYLDKKLVNTPVVAIGQATKETIRMGRLSKRNFKLSMEILLQYDEKKVNELYANEKVINTLEKEITNYLVLLSSHNLPDEDGKILSSTFHIINDIERIGDHAKNIVELAIEREKDNVHISGDAKKEIINMFDKTFKAVNMALESYENRDIEEALEVKAVEQSIDECEKELRENNILRLNKRVCTANVSAIFLDLISNFERIGDHSMNIAERVI